jgi:hypothetical protein
MSQIQEIHETDSPPPTIVPAGDTIEISKDWELAPRRLPEHSDADFKAIKASWCRGLTQRWRWWMDCRDLGRGRDPHVIGPADTTFSGTVTRFCWSPAAFRQGRRHGDFFIKSRLLAFDLDDGTPYREIRDALAAVGIVPFVSYHSPSSRAEHERYRVVLLLDSYVTRATAYSNLVAHCMKHLLRGHCDPDCKDAARVFFPGPELIEANEPADCLLGFEDLVAAIEVRIREADRHGNAARTAREVRERCGAADDGGIGAATPSGPRTRRSATEVVDPIAGGEETTLAPCDGPMANCDDSPPRSDSSDHGDEDSPHDSEYDGFPTHDDSHISLRVGDSSSLESAGRGEDSRTDGLPTHDDSYVSLRVGNPSFPESAGATEEFFDPTPPGLPARRDGLVPPQAAPGGTTSAAAPLVHVRGFPGLLPRECALAAELVTGLTPEELESLPDPDAEVHGWLREPELFGLMANVCGIRGGRDWFLGTLQQHPHLYGHFGEGHWEARIRTHRNNAREPQRCDRFCPHADACDHADTILRTIRSRSSLRITSRRDLVSLGEARRMLWGLVPDLLADRTPGRVDVVHAEPGIGKSECYIEWLARLGIAAIVAVPTHRLKDQIAARLRRAGVSCLTTPEVPELPADLADELEALYRVGDLDGARRWILDHQATLPELKAYVGDLERALASDGTVVTTHARLVQVLDRMGDERPVIIDEDPLKCLRPCGSVPLFDLLRLQEHMQGGDVAGVEALAEFVALLYALPNGTTIDTPEGLLGRVDPAAHLAAAGIHSRVICLLGSKHVLVSGSDSARAAHYCCGRDLPANRRIILLSATASEAIHRHVFGSEMRFHDIPLAAAVGRVVQSMGRTYSRTDIERRGVPELPEGYLFIGFKAIVDRFGEDAIGHFGAIEGLDEYGGRDIAVVGTPHMREETYHLLAHALGRTDRGMERLAYRTVEHDGMEFRFMTYRDDLLRTIQLHLIGSELEQAVGRARVLTEDCEVRVYSNLPLRRARHEV